MAGQILQQFPLHVYDVRREAVEHFVSRGAVAARDVAELGQHADIVCIAVVTAEQIREVLFDDGLAAALKPGAIVLIHSTVTPDTVLSIAVAARDHGVTVMDVAVSGGAAASDEGRLSVMIGGDEADVARCWPVLECIGEKIFHVGRTGAGAAVKIANNAMALMNQLSALEAMRLAAAYGIAEETLVDVASCSTGDSWAIRNWGFYDRLVAEHTLAGTDEMYVLLGKDLWYVTLAAKARNVPVPLAALGSQLSGTMHKKRRGEVSRD